MLRVEHALQQLQQFGFLGVSSMSRMRSQMPRLCSNSTARSYRSIFNTWMPCAQLRISWLTVLPSLPLPWADRGR